MNHNDVADLEQKLKAIPAKYPKIVAFEFVYSMDGGIAPIEAILDVAEKYGAITYIDEVYAVECTVKAVMVCLKSGALQIVSRLLRERWVRHSDVSAVALRVLLRCAILFVALPPDLSLPQPYRLLWSLRAHLKESQLERAGQRRQVARLRKMLDGQGIPHMENNSHIVPVMIDDPVKAKMLADYLRDELGIYVQTINYPTVPKGTERLRFTPSPLHMDADIDHLINALVSLWKQCAISHAVA